MRRRRLFLGLCIIFVAVFFWEPRRSFSKDGPHRFTMENGLNVILEENRTAPVVALQIW